MIDAIRLAQKKHREMIESLYEGMATVTEHRKVTDPETKLTSYREVVVLKDQPCRLSFEKIEAAEQDDQTARITKYSDPARIKDHCRTTWSNRELHIQR